SAAAAEARDVVVGGAVAVVIEPVADFGAGWGGAVAHLRAADAADAAQCADAAAGARREVAGRAARRARVAERLAEAVIDDAVAVVVEPVAGFGARADVRVALPHAADLLALRGADALRLPAHEVVDLPVAVVVEAVADFRGRNGRAHTRQRSALALEGARTAGARAGEAAAGRGNAAGRARRIAGLPLRLVDHAVAVVVEAVAGDFARRRDLSDAVGRGHTARALALRL